MENHFMHKPIICSAVLTLSVLSLVVGCKIERATIIPSDVPSLNRPATQLSRDAVARFPFPADFERGGEIAARAEVGYSINSINLLNYTGQNWTDVDLWINRQYVVNLSDVPTGKLVSINFKHLFSDQGVHFPTDNSVIKVRRVELRQGIRIFDVPVQAGR